MKENTRPRFKIWDLLVGYCQGERNPRMIEVSEVYKTDNLLWVYKDDAGHEIYQGNVEHAFDSDKKKWIR